MPKVWDEPVVVGDHLFFSPHQACQFLRGLRKNQERHPGNQAEGVLAAAIDGRVPPEEAREAFLAAVRLAHYCSDQSNPPDFFIAKSQFSIASPVTPF